MAELYPGASYYGIGKWLKRYVGWPDAVPFPGIVQHGFVIKPVAHDLQSAPGHFLWTHAHAAVARSEHGVADACAIGAPFLYVARLEAHRVRPPSVRRGSIFMLPHSSSLTEVSYALEDVLRFCRGLPSQLQPVRFCIYGSDVNSSLTDAIEAEGCSWYSNGAGAFDETLLSVFIDETSKARAVYSTQCTSALLYAQAIGVDSFKLPGALTYVNRDATVSYTSDDIQRTAADWETHLAWHGDLGGSGERRAFAMRALGHDAFQTPRHLRELMTEAASRKLYAQAVWAHYRASARTRMANLVRPVLARVGA